MGDDQGSCTFPIEVIFERNTYALQDSKYKRTLLSPTILLVFPTKQMIDNKRSAITLLTNQTFASNNSGTLLLNSKLT
jgi:hypothetical protein